MQKKAPVYCYSSQGHPQISQVPQLRSRTCGEGRTGDPILTSEVFHALQVMLALKPGDHEGLTLFIHGRLLKRTLLLVLPALLIQIPIRAPLTPVPVCCRGQSGTAWCCPAAAGGMLGNSVSVLDILPYSSHY